MTGIVRAAHPGLLRVGGLPGAMLNEQVVCSDGSCGWALRLEEDAVVVAPLNRPTGSNPGTVTGTGHLLRTPTGPALLGRVVDPLGRPLDGRGPIPTEPVRLLDPPGPEFIEATSPREPMSTGVKFLDALYPMGWGQSRAVVGPPGTGKTALALDVILHQREAVCVYAAVGQPGLRLASTVKALRNAGAMSEVIVVATTPDDPPALRLLTPLAACSQAEWLAREQGRKTLCVFDDLDAIATAARELATHLGALAGRVESAETLGWLRRLLNRPCRLASGGAVSAISILDGDPNRARPELPGPLTSYFSDVIVLTEDRYRAGQRPAIDLAQTGRAHGRCPLPALQALRNSLEWSLLSTCELEAFARTGAELDRATDLQLAHGRLLQRALNQPAGHPVPPRDQFLTLFAVLRGHTNSVPSDRFSNFERELPGWLVREYPALVAMVVGRFDPYGDAGRELDAAVAAFTGHFLRSK